MDERDLAARLYSALLIAGQIAERRDLDGYPSAIQLIEFVTRNFGGDGGLMPLAAPTDTPPARRVGYFSDGAQHAAAVTVSAAGHRLFIEWASDEVLHTNVERYLDPETWDLGPRD